MTRWEDGAGHAKNKEQVGGSVIRGKEFPAVGCGMRNEQRDPVLTAAVQCSKIVGKRGFLKKRRYRSIFGGAFKIYLYQVDPDKSIIVEVKFR